MTEHHDPDLGCTPWERTRRTLHRSVDTICTVWPDALEDANARGYPTGIDYNTRTTSSESTSVEAAALQPSYAVVWLATVNTAFTQLTPPPQPALLHPQIETLCVTWPANAEALTRTIIALANTGITRWPPPLKAGQTAAGVKVGGRANSVEICVYCGQPVAGGVNDPLRRVGPDSDPVHRTPCWYQLTMSRSPQHQMLRIFPKGNS